MEKNVITIKANINAPVETIWKAWTTPEDIMQWNSASDDWHTPHAENDLKPGGKFMSRMAAKDGSMAFDFGGTYDDVKTDELISYTMDDGRHVEITFEDYNTNVLVTVKFEAEDVNSLELQRMGWQAILDNFKKYVESK
ncbi:MAG TPA: SRPBCC family protein [Saprospiraceae bacterium]|nr:SRPBCC family protein [Saprospiraceae bacterium]